MLCCGVSLIFQKAADAVGTKEGGGGREGTGFDTEEELGRGRQMWFLAGGRVLRVYALQASKNTYTV